MSDHFDLGDLQALAQDTLTRAGVDATSAKVVARDVALSELARDPDGGFTGLLRDIRLIRYGRLSPNGKITVSAAQPGVVAVDGGHGFAAVAVSEGLPALKTAACLQGVAMMRLQNASAPGAMAVGLATLADAGLAGIAMRAGGSPYAIRPKDVRAIPLQPSGDAAPLSSLLALAPPVGDHPVEGPVNYQGWLMALDTDATGVDALLDTLPRESTSPSPAGIALEPELLAQIVTA